MRTKSTAAFFIRSPKLNQHQILRHLASDPNITQAELGRRCHLSVAMVNNYMKELCNAGLMQYRRKSTKSVSYHLTAAGEREVENVETELMKDMADSFAGIKEHFRDRILAQTPVSLRRVVLFGSGHFAQLAFLALETSGISVVGICDDDPSQIGRDWCGRKVLDPSHIPYMDPDAVIFADADREPEICDSLAKLQDYGIRLVRLHGCNDNFSDRRHNLEMVSVTGATTSK